MNQDMLFCARCQTMLKPGQGDFWEVHIEAVADPWPPVFTEEDLRRDVGGEWAELVEQMAGLTPRQAMEQVHRHMVIHLCRCCFEAWYEAPVG